MTTAAPSDNVAADFLQPEGDSQPRLLIMMEGNLEDIVKAIPRLLTQLGKGGKRGPKLNAETAATIRRRVAAGESKEVLAQEFCVKLATVENILANRSYPEDTSA
jgi:DNA invertase Pin-like site-specific DNA recombinase